MMVIIATGAAVKIIRAVSHVQEARRICFLFLLIAEVSTASADANAAQPQPQQRPRCVSRVFTFARGERG